MTWILTWSYSLMSDLDVSPSRCLVNAYLYFVRCRPCWSVGTSWPWWDWRYFSKGPLPGSLPFMNRAQCLWSPREKSLELLRHGTRATGKTAKFSLSSTELSWLAENVPQLPNFLFQTEERRKEPPVGAYTYAHAHTPPLHSLAIGPRHPPTHWLTLLWRSQMRTVPSSLPVANRPVCGWGDNPHSSPSPCPWTMNCPWPDFSFIWITSLSLVPTRIEPYKELVVRDPH